MLLLMGDLGSDDIDDANVGGAGLSHQRRPQGGASPPLPSRPSSNSGEFSSFSSPAKRW